MFASALAFYEFLEYKALVNHARQKKNPSFQETD